MMENRDLEFQVFVKPAGARCNLRCTYCYYLDKEELLHGGQTVMSASLLEKYIIQHLEASGGSPVFFSWHGGEPTLAGVGFFRQAAAWQKKYRKPEQQVFNGIQTNATLLNDTWCRFFTDENFMVGVSLDGTQPFHDLYRQNRQGQSTFYRTMKGLELLRAYGIPFEILCVVHRDNVKAPLEVYRFFRSLGARFITFLPLVEHRPGSQEGVSPASVPSSDFGKFLCTIFDEWKKKDIGRLQVQIFEEALRTAFHPDHTLCIFKKTCGRVPVVEWNGDFYSCDHYVDQSHLLGNIGETDLQDLLDDPRQLAFGRAKRDSLPRFCLECEVLDMCNGECPKNRFIKTPGGEPGLNYLCAGYRLFFNHVKPFADTVAAVWNGGDS